MCKFTVDKRGGGYLAGWSFVYFMYKHQEALALGSGTPGGQSDPQCEFYTVLVRSKKVCFQKARADESLHCHGDG